MEKIKGDLNSGIYNLKMLWPAAKVELLSSTSLIVIVITDYKEERENRLSIILVGFDVLLLHAAAFLHLYFWVLTLLTHRKLAMLSTISEKQFEATSNSVQCLQYTNKVCRASHSYEVKVIDAIDAATCGRQKW